MNTKNNGVADKALGADPQKVLTIEDVKKMLQRDMSAMIHMMDAIYKDQDVFNALATHLHGKYLNAKHQEELERQQELKL